jgi:ABC-type polysaccharide/polyol phosphate export permease
VLVFASTAFAPADNMPRVLQIYNDWQPVSVVVKAMRALSIGGETTAPVEHALLWMIALVAIFAPLAISRYRRAT